MRYKITDRDNIQQFKYLIDNKYYYFRAVLFNPDSILLLNKTAIKKLFLSDNIFNFYIDGYVIIDNNEDVIEKYKDLPINSEFDNNHLSEEGYKMRGDGRDILGITIIPLAENSNSFSTGALDDATGLNYYFILENETNLDSSDGSLKKYDIVDIDYEILRERKFCFTTADLVNIEDATQVSNVQRQAYTGDCIKYILEKVIGEKGMFEQNDEGETPNFESGLNKIFFSTPSDMTAYESIEYLLDLHVSNDANRDFSIFNKDSFTGEFRLQSISELFRNAYIDTGSLDIGGAYFLENFNITGSQNSDNIKVNDIKKPNITLELGDMSDVIDVNFFNIPAKMYNEKVVSTIVNSYDFDNKKFVINTEDGNIENVKAEFTTNYVNNMKGRSKKPFPSFITNNTKKENLAYNNSYTIYPSYMSLLSQGKNKVLYSALLLNIGVELTVKGNISRSSGKFFSIDRRGDYIDNTFDNKFLGIYFIVNIEHDFDGNQFYNKITAIKTYHFTDPKINEDIR